MERNGITWAKHRGAYELDECEHWWCIDCNIVKAPGRHRRRAFL